VAMVETLVVLDPLADLARFEGVASAVAAATNAVDAMLRGRGLRNVTDEEVSQALLAGAGANAALTDDPQRWRVGALRLSAELAPLAALIRVAPAQALARAHAVVARGVVPDGELGKIRSEPGIAARMNSLGDLLTRQTSAPAIVVGAVAEIAVVAPFAEASGLIARAAEHLVLIAAGLDPYGVIVVEAGHAVGGATYSSALQAYADGSVAGVTDWVLRCAMAVARGAELSPVAGADRPSST
jgi:hypothetical protein